MSTLKQSARPLRSLQCVKSRNSPREHVIRTFTSTPSAHDEVEAVAQPTSTGASSKYIEPNLAHTPKLESRLLRRRSMTPIGSRRRRAALQAGEQFPFEQLPYQCFQEARKVLQVDRAEKLKQIEAQRAKLQRLMAADTQPQNEASKERRMKSMAEHLEELKVWADINDPVVKRRFEDGKGESARHDIGSSKQC